MKMNFNELSQLNIILSNIVNKELSVDTILKLIDFKNELDLNMEKHRKAFKKILSDFGLNYKDGEQVSWEEHSEKNNIDSKINELMQINLELKMCNFVSNEEFIKLCSNLNIGQISFMGKYIKV